MLACDTYDLAEGRIKAFSRSSIRAKIMLCLMDGPKTASEMEKNIGTRVSTILHAIKEMSGEDLIAKTSRGYSLTNIGAIEALLLEELMNTVVVLDRHNDFWLSHDLSGIPLELQKKIGMLAQSNVVAGDPVALLRAQEYFMESVLSSKEVRGLSPIIIPGYAEAIASTVENGAQVDLVLTDSILKIVLGENRNALEYLIGCDNFRLHRINDGIKVAFTVTDVHLYLGLYMLDGSYDLGRDLFCTGEGATKWGLELFDYYFSFSEPVRDI
jgi:predicted transcriptional regulator